MEAAGLFLRQLQITQLFLANTYFLTLTLNLIYIF